MADREVSALVSPVGQGRSRKGSVFGKRLAIRGSGPLKMAYADPPYVGMGHRYPEGIDVDHRELITRLESEFHDGWALSAGANSLGYLLPLCPPGTRVGAWLKPFYGYKPGVSPQYTWEPVIFIGGRRQQRVEHDPVRDSIVAGPAPAFIGNPVQSVGGRPSGHKEILGRKPVGFCRWILELLNVQPGDEFIDLFPGSGVMGRALSAYLADFEPDKFQLEA